MQEQTFKSNGKLLITGEYLVLDGAKAFAIPSKYGQEMKADVSSGESQILWQAEDVHGSIWLKSTFTFQENGWQVSETNNEKSSEWLCQLFNHILERKPNLFVGKSIRFHSKLNFERDWGLGSSSTFLNNLAQWAQVDAFELLYETSQGSGYDLACAQSNSPIMFQRMTENHTITKIDFNPPFAENLFFVHLGLKQSSAQAIEFYEQKRTKKRKIQAAIAQINEISETLPFVNSLDDFNQLISEHEKIMADVLDMEMVKNALFESFPGAIKSLGAWGGDFVLATGNNSDMDYFRNYGMNTIIPFNQMIY